jgi:hypothetical protein
VLRRQGHANHAGLSRRLLHFGDDHNLLMQCHLANRRHHCNSCLPLRSSATASVKEAASPSDAAASSRCVAVGTSCQSNQRMQPPRAPPPQPPHGWLPQLPRVGPPHAGAAQPIVPPHLPSLPRWLGHAFRGSYDLHRRLFRRKGVAGEAIVGHLGKASLSALIGRPTSFATMSVCTKEIVTLDLSELNFFKP